MQEKGAIPTEFHEYYNVLLASQIITEWLQELDTEKSENDTDIEYILKHTI